EPDRPGVRDLAGLEPGPHESVGTVVVGLGQVNFQLAGAVGAGRCGGRERAGRQNDRARPGEFHRGFPPEERVNESSTCSMTSRAKRGRFVLEPAALSITYSTPAALNECSFATISSGVPISGLSRCCSAVWAWARMCEPPARPGARDTDSVRACTRLLRSIAAS